MKKLRILSLGAGVQSSTLALMIEKGEVPMVDAAIFSDTMSEPKAVYDWLKWLKTKLSYPVYIVKKGDLKKDTIQTLADYHQFSLIPVYTKNKITGKAGLSRRQCTNHYKIIPVNKKVRELLGLQKGERVKKDVHVQMLMGISKDETFRMKINPKKYITNIYPLVERDFRRIHCVEWMEKNNYPKPPRSACTFCPFHNNEEWKLVKENKQEWDEVVELDNFIRNKSKNKDEELFLHNSKKPIDEIDFDEKTDQLDLFTNECEGMCGV
tara:strand:- start:182 stop:982 length:801 start_codon:yes stop_codon:yes gene_type:complete